MKFLLGLTIGFALTSGWVWAQGFYDQTPYQQQQALQEQHTRNLLNQYLLQQQHDRMLRPHQPC